METLNITNTKKIIEIVKKANTKLIYVAGASASGKSYFAKILANKLKKLKKNVLEISSDDYYSNETSLQFMLYGTFDHPKLIDYKLLQKNINEYFKIGKTQIPQYSFKESRRIGYTIINKHKNPKDNYDYIIVEGLYTINQLKNTHNPLKIFVHSDTEELIFRRIIRDQKRVTESIDTIVGMLGKVFPMRRLYGESQNKTAEIIIHNDYQIIKKEAILYTANLLHKAQLKTKLKNSGDLIKKEFIYDYIYNDNSDKNGVIYVSEVYKKKSGLLDHIIITKSKHKDYKDETYDRILVKLYRPGSLTMIHTLLQTAGLKLIGQNKKIEYTYKNIKLKKSRNKRYLIKQQG